VNEVDEEEVSPIVPAVRSRLKVCEDEWEEYDGPVGGGGSA
jgi:hypothetical protein